MTDNNIVKVPVSNIRPYERNPRDNSDSIEKVAESIRSFGFLQPIVCDSDGVILAGHTRYQAALSLGLAEVPVLYANDLTPAQAKAYRLADNKVGEESRWLNEFLFAELEALELEAPDLDVEAFGFEAADDMRRQNSWHNAGKRCNLTRKITLREKEGFLYTSFYSVGKEGRPIEEIKEDPSLVPVFADNLCDYILKTLGGNLDKGDWCICTTPRRRHKEGFHFSTEICRAASGHLGIPFHEGAIESKSRSRIMTDFTLVADPPEHNVILYDDIMSTGITMRDSRDLLTEAGHSVLPVVAIRNQ